MTRVRFLLAALGFGGVAKAQTGGTGTVHSDGTSTLTMPTVGTIPDWTTKKAKNNQCPVCGEMSDVRRKVGFGLARCARCNVAFWQDAE